MLALACGTGGLRRVGLGGVNAEASAVHTSPSARRPADASRRDPTCLACGAAGGAAAVFHRAVVPHVLRARSLLKSPVPGALRSCRVPAPVPVASPSALRSSPSRQPPAAGTRPVIEPDPLLKAGQAVLAGLGTRPAPRGRPRRAAPSRTGASALETRSGA